MSNDRSERTLEDGKSRSITLFLVTAAVRSAVFFSTVSITEAERVFFLEGEWTAAAHWLSEQDSLKTRDYKVMVN